MYDSKNLLYLLTILEAIEKISIYSNDFLNPLDLLQANDQMNFNACNNLLIAIGEESKKISLDLKSNFPDFPWNEVACLRNKLAHDYRGVDPDIIFSVIKDYLSELKNIIIEMVNMVNPDLHYLSQVLATDYYNHIRYLIKSH